MKNEYNKILDNLMEKISKAVADEEYDKVVIYNEELCKAVIEMTDNCAEDDKESLFNLISDASWSCAFGGRRHRLMATKSFSDWSVWYQKHLPR